MAGPLTLSLVDPQDRRAMAEVHALWARLYRDDPAWVPPLAEWLRRRLAPSNSFFRQAELRLFLARRGSQDVGSISALRDHQHEQHRGEAAAFFGFFETQDDPAVAALLLERAADEARG